MAAWRTTLLLLAVGAVAALMPATPASAHTLSVAKAKAAAEQYGREEVMKGNPEYIAVSATCRKLYPHRVRCKVRYQRAANAGACIETLMMFYRAHKEGETSGPLHYHVARQPLTHRC
jgi:hypothetical protein